MHMYTWGTFPRSTLFAGAYLGVKPNFLAITLIMSGSLPPKGLYSCGVIP